MACIKAAWCYRMWCAYHQAREMKWENKKERKVYIRIHTRSLSREWIKESITNVSSLKDTLCVTYIHTLNQSWNECVSVYRHEFNTYFILVWRKLFFYRPAIYLQQASLGWRKSFLQTCWQPHYQNQRMSNWNRWNIKQLHTCLN